MKITIFALAALPFLANASGLLLQEAVYANAGTAGAGDGVHTKSATAIFTNPATMSFMGESALSINTLLLDMELSYSDDNQRGDGSADTMLPVVGAFYTKALTEKLHGGINFSITSGSGVNYGSDWAGSHALKSVFLSAAQVNPAVSYRINESLSMAGGLQFGYALLNVETQALELSDIATDTAWGYNLGLMFQQERWAAGLSFRSAVDFEFDSELEGKLGAGIVNTVIATSIFTPNIVDISTSYQLNEKFSLLGSIQWHNWSEMDATPVLLNSNVVYVERDWEDVWRYTVGTEYQLNSSWRLKAGFSYETSPQDDPAKQWVDLPVGETYRYSMGASYQFSDITVDTFYEYTDFGSIEIDRQGTRPIQGTFDGRVHFIGANFLF
ncbi:OmpP1/FadL family transporter [Photobacterium rosenbergii]|uniref:OmpP1/FadL family transporter n=1 Tax=Photobacterium rosenbergii TaxID=294936 RepID=UPI001C99B720|nr:outer membrane protein transport protein [Photobacterium rosenbergii]MBY5948375.1 outer membrane protein transport protein [Photobacterium rosenbergii]